MLPGYLTARQLLLVGSLVALTLAPNVSRAGDNDTAELKKLLEAQARQIEALNQQIDAASSAAAGGAKNNPNLYSPQKVIIDDASIRKIVAEYLQENPGVGMPPSVQVGYGLGGGPGFTIRSAPNPSYASWQDESKIPFELRIRGRVQMDYYFYKVADNLNHQTGFHYAPAVGDLSSLLIKRGRLVFDGTAFTPNLRYEVQLDGNTRGIASFQNNDIVQNSGGVPGGGGHGAPGIGTAPSAIGGTVISDHAERLYAAWVAYDFHPCCASKGCGAGCCDGTPMYAPTLSLIAGKQKPFFALEEILGSANQQFVEYSMADYFFDADDDNFLTAAGVELRAFEDRLYVKALVTNGNESQFPISQMDDLPGLNVGFWYDFGGSWDCDRQQWQLFGDCLADIDYSCNPVVRVGGAINDVWMGRRSIYGDVEQSRVFVMPAGPRGTRIFNELNGDGTTPAGARSLDKFDSYTSEVFVAAKYRGFSLSNEWWVRDLNNFHAPVGLNQIIYPIPQANGTSVNALFTRGSLTDYGMQLQGGYFIIPKHLELVARWSWIRGESGDLNGNGSFQNVNVAGVGSVRIMNGAFQHHHEADEFAVGVNYYFKRQLLKWQTDIGVYQGGNPVGGGASAAGFITGVDGWMLRSQIQVAF